MIEPRLGGFSWFCASSACHCLKMVSDTGQMTEPAVDKLITLTVSVPPGSLLATLAHGISNGSEPSEAIWLKVY